MPYWSAAFDRRFAYLLAIHETIMWLREKFGSVVSGQPRSLFNVWQPPSVRFITDEEGRFKEYPDDPTPPPPYLRGSDFSEYQGALVLNTRAVEILSPLMGSAVELLPLRCEEGEFWVLNVLRVLDCLDREHSVFTYWDSGKIKGVRRYVFQPGCLEGQQIFKLPVLNYWRIYVSQVFKDLVDEHDLRGLDFRLAPWETQTD